MVQVNTLDRDHCEVDGRHQRLKVCPLVTFLFFGNSNVTKTAGFTVCWDISDLLSTYLPTPLIFPSSGVTDLLFSRFKLNLHTLFIPMCFQHHTVCRLLCCPLILRSDWQNNGDKKAKRKKNSCFFHTILKISEMHFVKYATSSFQSVIERLTNKEQQHAKTLLAADDD